MRGMPKVHLLIYRSLIENFYGKDNGVDKSRVPNNLMVVKQ